MPCCDSKSSLLIIVMFDPDKPDESRVYSSFFGLIKISGTSAEILKESVSKNVKIKNNLYNRFKVSLFLSYFKSLNNPDFIPIKKSHDALLPNGTHVKLSIQLSKSLSNLN